MKHKKEIDRNDFEISMFKIIFYGNRQATTLNGLQFVYTHRPLQFHPCPIQIDRSDAGLPF